MPVRRPVTCANRCGAGGSCRDKSQRVRSSAAGRQSAPDAGRARGLGARRDRHHAAAAAAPLRELLRRAGRGAVRRDPDAGVDPDPDAAAAADRGLRQSSRAHARHGVDRLRPRSRALLRDRLADRSQPDDGPRRAAARADDRHLQGGSGVHDRHVCPDALRHARAQSRPLPPLVAAAADRGAAALQLRLPDRRHELPVRHRHRAVGDRGVDRAARAALAVAHGDLGDLRHRAVLLSSVRARHLWACAARHRERAPVEPPQAAAGAAPRRLRGHRNPIPACPRDVADEPDLGLVQPERMGRPRQDRRAQIRLRGLLRHGRVHADRRLRRRHRLGAAPAPAALPSRRADAARSSAALSTWRCRA